MKSGQIVLYSGTILTGIVTLICIIGWPKITSTTTLVMWGIALITLITGSIIDGNQKESCCGDYAEIFNQAINKPKNIDKSYNTSQNGYSRHQYDVYGSRHNVASNQYRYMYF